MATLWLGVGYCCLSIVTGLYNLYSSKDSYKVPNWLIGTTMLIGAGRIISALLGGL